MLNMFKDIKYNTENLGKEHETKRIKEIVKLKKYNNWNQKLSDGFNRSSDTAEEGINKMDNSVTGNIQKEAWQDRKTKTTEKSIVENKGTGSGLTEVNSESLKERTEYGK